MNAQLINPEPIQPAHSYYIYIVRKVWKYYRCFSTVAYLSYNKFCLNTTGQFNQIALQWIWNVKRHINVESATDIAALNDRDSPKRTAEYAVMDDDDEQYGNSFKKARVENQCACLSSSEQV